jgi:hypothetical protein
MNLSSTQMIQRKDKETETKLQKSQGKKRKRSWKCNVLFILVIATNIKDIAYLSIMAAATWSHLRLDPGSRVKMEDESGR